MNLPKRPKICVIYGPPCAGKSTLARSLCGKNDVVFDYDRIIRALTYEKVHDCDDKPAHNIVLAMRKAFIDALTTTDRIETAYILCLWPSDWLYRKLLFRSFPVSCVRVQPKVDECLERLALDTSRPDKDSWMQKIRDWFSKHGEAADI